MIPSGKALWSAFPAIVNCAGEGITGEHPVHVAARSLPGDARI